MRAHSGAARKERMRPIQIKNDRLEDSPSGQGEQILDNLACFDPRVTNCLDRSSVGMIVVHGGQKHVRIAPQLQRGRY